jgi:hypothetical protein
LSTTCVPDEQDNGIPAPAPKAQEQESPASSTLLTQAFSSKEQKFNNLEILHGKLGEINDISENPKKLLQFVKSNREWLRLPPVNIDDDINPFTKPVTFRGHRINAISDL